MPGVQNCIHGVVANKKRFSHTLQQNNLLRPYTEPCIQPDICSSIQKIKFPRSGTERQKNFPDNTTLIWQVTPGIKRKHPFLIHAS